MPQNKFHEDPDDIPQPYGYIDNDDADNLKPHKPYKVNILWGAHPEPDWEPTLYEFATETELHAFLLGIDEADGWAGYSIIEDEPEDDGPDPADNIYQMGM